MNRTILLVAVALLAVLAGCSGGTSDDGSSGVGETTTESVAGGNGGSGGSDGTGGDAGSNSGDDSATTAAPEGGTTTAAAGPARPELAMLQFDRTERYEYDIVYVGGVEGTTYVDVVVEGTDATINVTSLVGERRLVDTYTVPTNDPDAVIDAMEDDIRRGGVGYVLQSQDITSTFVTENIAWEVGAEYRSPYGNATVTGRDTVAGVDCLTYEYSIEGTVLEEGCITPALEMPVVWEKYFSDGSVRSSFTLVAYREG